MPSLSILGTAAQICRGPDASHFHPCRDIGLETRCFSDVEAAVTVQNRGIASIELESPARTDKHGYASAVFALIKNLARFKIRWVEVDLAAANQRALSGSDVQPEVARGNRVTGKLVEHLLVAQVRGRPLRCAQPRQFNLRHRFSLER